MKAATVAIVAAVFVGIIAVVAMTVIADTFFNRAWKDYESDE